jgi:hypothetical protein
MPGRNIAFFSLLGFILTLLYCGMVVAPRKSAAFITQTLQQAGFTSVSIGTLRSSAGGIHATNIALDDKGIEGIAKIDVGINWPFFILFGSVKDITITGLELTRTQAQSQPFINGVISFLESHPDRNIELNTIQYDLLTPLGVLRLNGDLSLHAQEDDKNQIKAKLSANQFQLGFQSQWSGTMTKDGVLDLYGEVMDGRIHIGAFKMARLSGWNSISGPKNNLSFLSSLIAGSAELAGAPLQSPRVDIEISPQSKKLVTRAHFSNAPDTYFTADIEKAGSVEQNIISVQGKSFSSFVKDISGDTSKLSKSLEGLGPFSINASLQESARTQNDPFAYDIKAGIENQPIMTGNILFYPKTLEVRGSVNVGEKLLSPLADYLDIPSEQASGDYLKIDLSFAQKKNSP